MTVLDFGCGPGYFTIPIAQMVGKSGRVIAADLQEGMLQKIREKIQGTELEQRITLHKCEANKIGISKKVDFVLAFYVVHEVPDKRGFFKEILSALKSNGTVFIAEPPFRVSKAEFEKTLRKAGDAGFTVVERPQVLLSKAAILRMSDLSAK